MDRLPHPASRNVSIHMWHALLSLAACPISIDPCSLEILGKSGQRKRSYAFQLWVRSSATKDILFSRGSSAVSLRRLQTVGLLLKPADKTLPSCNARTGSNPALSKLIFIQAAPPYARLMHLSTSAGPVPRPRCKTKLAYVVCLCVSLGFHRHSTPHL